ncbi:MAG: DNA polymerase III subunit beta [Candidatus Caenarcaniphilales bacterium]|nr:DNA polymerase III subunit beta [Candidatus Caenarcaniphilales bacterium]
MKLKVSQKLLDKAIKSVNKAVPAKGIQPILNNIYLKTLGEKLLLNATDLDFWIEATIPANNLNEGSVAISAKKIEEISSKFSDEELDLFMEDEKKILEIGSEKIKFDLIGLPGDDFPAFEKPDFIDQDFISINRQEFLDLLNVVQISASRFDLNNILGGIYIGIKQEEDNSYFLEFASSDGGRLSAYKMKLDNINETHKFANKAVIVPIKIILDVQKILDTSVDDNVEIGFLSSRVVFKTEDRYVVSRILEGEYPNYMELVPKTHDKEAIINRKDLQQALDRVSVMANEVTNMVKFSFNDNQMTLECSNLDFGNAVESLEVVSYNGSEFEINFNVRFIMDYLKVIDSDNIVIHMNANESPALVKPEQGQEHIYVIMPLKSN